jgi:hypothetical protein
VCTLATLSYNVNNVSVKFQYVPNLIASRLTACCDSLPPSTIVCVVVNSQPHPHIVQHHYVWEYYGYIYTAMDLCPNGNIDSLKPQYSEAEIWEYLTDVLLVCAFLSLSLSLSLSLCVCVCVCVL